MLVRPACFGTFHGIIAIIHEKSAGVVLPTCLRAATESPPPAAAHPLRTDYEHAAGRRQPRVRLDTLAPRSPPARRCRPPGTHRGSPMSGSHRHVEAVAFRRLATPIAKYWVSKRGPHHAYEALWGQRLYRIVPARAPVSGAAANGDLGRFGQRDCPRCSPSY
jgi:hypothetical protein